MGPLSQYPADPDGTLASRPLYGDTPLSVLAHEAGHQWLAFASVRDPDYPYWRPMLDPPGSHWSPVFNAEGSLMDGGKLVERSPGEFEFTATGTGFSLLDQYLMGLRPSSEVPPSFYVVPFEGYFNLNWKYIPYPGLSFRGVRRDVTVEQLIAAVGERKPAPAASQRVFRFAFVLIAGPDGTAAPEQLQQLETYRSRFADYFKRVTGGLAEAETGLWGGPLK